MSPVYNEACGIQTKEWKTIWVLFQSPLKASFDIIPSTTLFGIWPINNASRSAVMVPEEMVKWPVTAWVMGYFAPGPTRTFSNCICSSAANLTLCASKRASSMTCLLRWQYLIHLQSSQSSLMKTGVRLGLKWFSRPNCLVKVSPGATYRYVIFPWDQMICCSRSSWFFLSIQCYSGHHIFPLGLHAKPPGVLAKFFSRQIHNWKYQWYRLYRHGNPRCGHQCW